MKTTLFSSGPLPLLVLAVSFAAGCGSEGTGNNTTDASSTGSGGTASGSSSGSGGATAGSGSSSSSGTGGAASSSSTGSSMSASSGTGGGSAGSCFNDYLTKAVYESLFPHRNALYEYDALVAAAQAYPAFCTEGTPDEQKREVAAFLANISHETTGGWDMAPDGPFAWGLYWTEEFDCMDTMDPNTCIYCDAMNVQYPCVDGQKYYGRGPIQLTWNYNYGQMGEVLGENLLANPDLVLSNGVIAFKTALWFWMTAQPPKPSAHDVMTGKWMPSAQDQQMGRVPGFGMTINIINGGLECGKQTPPQVDDRVGFYMTFTTAFTVDAGPNLYCDQMTPY